MIFFSKHWFFSDLPPKFQIFIVLHLLSTSLKPQKFIIVHKSSKSSINNFQVPKKRVIYDLGHGNFGVKFFRFFSSKHWFFLTFHKDFTSLSHFIHPLHLLNLKNSNLYTNLIVKTHKYWFLVLKSRVFQDVGHKNFGFKFFWIFLS